MDRIFMPKTTFIGYSDVFEFTSENRKDIIVKFWEENTTEEAFNGLFEYANKLGVVGITLDVSMKKSEYFVGVDTIKDPIQDQYRVITIDEGFYYKITCTGALPDSIRNKEIEVLNQLNYKENGPIIEVYPEGDPYSKDYICYLLIRV